MSRQKRAPQPLSPPPVRAGVSACLLGQRVRYDGQHKRDAFLVDELGPHVQWVPVCPEVEAGMPVPRPTVRLVRAGRARAAGLKLKMISKTGTDFTAAMNRFARQRVRQLVEAQLSGYVFKSRSPSCGVEGVPIHSLTNAKAPPVRAGRGLFAAALMAALPDLPVEEESRLHDARVRENFIERLFAYRRLQDLFAGRWTASDLAAFHGAHKLALLAHAPAILRDLDRLVARAYALTTRNTSATRARLRDGYRTRFMAGMARIATPARHGRVLLHVLAGLRRGLSDRDRHALKTLIQDYRQGRVPLIVPITLFRHHVDRLEVVHLQGQTYLQPHPQELLLRNRV